MNATPRQEDASRLSWPCEWSWIPGSPSAPRNDGDGSLPYYVYLLASRRHGTLYLGVTNNPGRRVWEHRAKAHKGFSAKYGVDRLVWYESYERIDEAISREKSIKKWRRDWKISLIEAFNPEWSDLYDSLAN